MVLDALGWVVTDGQGRFLAAGGVEGPAAWVEDAAQALVFRELWAAMALQQASAGMVLPWATAMQVGACADSAFAPA
ncbi:MAG TPA: hypothetical protein VM241_01045 [Candidatus Thermoplasmatota archaeon]|nr:hypothetical protein [Candidatus Thermoplasmatota archaeon]